MQGKNGRAEYEYEGRMNFWNEAIDEGAFSASFFVSAGAALRGAGPEKQRFSRLEPQSRVS